MTITEFDQLERKIQAAAKLLDHLREEKRDLERQNRELKERIRGPGKLGRKREVVGLEAATSSPQIGRAHV